MGSEMDRFVDDREDEDIDIVIADEEFRCSL
jgi:hypothetical protein